MIAKTQEEREILRESGRRLARHVRALCAMVAPGVAVVDLEKKARELVEDDGDTLAFYKYPSGKHGEQFPGGLCVSINDAVVHGPAAISDYVIQEGDIVKIDFGIKHRGLITDHAASVVAGKASEEDVRLIAGTREALLAGIAAAECGNTIGDIGHAIERVAKKYGFGYPKILAGHGVGRDVHEDPHVPNYGIPKTGERLEDGLVIAIEPMMTLGKGDVYIDKDAFTYRTKDRSRSAHEELTVLITKEGTEILTKE